jgi:putative ABC transport system permease protein
MFKINLKIAWRNLVHHQWYTVFNIGGLSIGITAFILLLLYRNHLASYDNWDPGFRNLYQLTLVNKNSIFGGESLSPKTIPLLTAQVPEIKAATRVYNGNEDGLLRIGENKFYEKAIVNVDSTFFAVFPFRLKAGDRKTALQNPNSIVLSEELADKYFGHSNPIGQIVHFDEKKDYIVTGVLARPAGPSRVRINALMRITVPDWANWGNMAYKNYLLLPDNVDHKAIEEKMSNVFFRAAYDEMKEWIGWPPSLQTFLQDKDHDHLEIKLASEMALYKMKKELFVLSLLSSIILFVACMNFTNQTIAGADKRAKEIGVRKVVGGSRLQLCLQFLVEIFIQCFFALLLACIFTELLLPLFNRLTEEDIHLFTYFVRPAFVAQLIAVLLGVTLLSGLYPALYLSSFIPARVLKGNLERGSGGMLFRRLLLGLQFTFSMAFIISLIIISKQTRYMTHYDKGFEPNGLVYTLLQEENSKLHFDYVKQRLLEIPHVTAVSRTDRVPMNVNSTNNFDMFTWQDKAYHIQEIRVDNDYFKTLGAQIKQGQEFTVARPSDTLGIVVNETLVKLLNIPEPVVGKYLVNKYGGTNRTPIQLQIRGVVKDFMIKDFDEPILPTVFYHQGSGINQILSGFPAFCLLRIDPHYFGETMARVTDLWREVEPRHPIVYFNSSDDFKEVTKSIDRLEKIVSLFAVVTIIIALVGLLALVAFNLKLRLKEIGIRKVVGASVKDLLQLMCGEFIYMLLAANVFACLMAYLLMYYFLNAFAYRITMPYMIYPAIFGCSVAVTLLIICVRSWQAIRTTPAEVLKYE